LLQSFGTSYKNCHAEFLTPNTDYERSGDYYRQWKVPLALNENEEIEDDVT
jgi:hypothetical protein